jgi:hypothetical protein
MPVKDAVLIDARTFTEMREDFATIFMAKGRSIVSKKLTSACAIACVIVVIKNIIK